MHLLEPAKSSKGCKSTLRRCLSSHWTQSHSVWVLGATGMLGPLTINRLAEAIVMDRTTLTRNLRPLEKQGLLRIRSGKDRREREVSITKRGQVILAKGYPLWKKAQGKVVKGLGQQRVNRLLKDLSAVVNVAQQG